jgi:hypothetical protein
LPARDKQGPDAVRHSGELARYRGAGAGSTSPTLVPPEPDLTNDMNAANDMVAAFMSFELRLNCMNAAFMQYERAREGWERSIGGH